MISGLNHGIITMTKGETALFRMPSELAYGVEGMDGVPPNSSVQFEVELISWITVVDVCKDGGIIKKIIEKGEMMGPPGELDEVRGKKYVYLEMLSRDSKLILQSVSFLSALIFVSSMSCPLHSVLFVEKWCNMLIFLAVKYTATIDDGAIVAKTPEDGLEFYVKECNFKTLMDIY